MDDYDCGVICSLFTIASTISLADTTMGLQSLFCVLFVVYCEEVVGYSILTSIVCSKFLFVSN